MIQIQTYKTLENPALARHANAIRHAVFVVGQHVEPALEYEFEEDANHYLLTVNGRPAATARWRETDKGIKLERFATLDKYQGQGYGSMLLKKLLEDVLPFNKKIYLHAQALAQDFYEKHGFIKQGKLFYEANIAHFMMIYPEETK